MWLRGEALFARKDYYKAFEQYEELLGEYAGSPHYGDALQREMEIAELYLGPVRRKVLGMPLLSGEDEAIAILRRVYEHQPLGDLADDVILRIADYYWNKRDWPEAEQYYDKYCREYPNVDPGKVRHAERRRAECGLEKCRGVRYDTTSLNLAYDRLNQYEQKYPDAAQSEGVAELKAKVRGMQAETMFRVAEYYLRSGRPTAAAYYAEQVQRDYPDTAWSAKSERFLQKLAMKAPPTPSEAAPPAPEPPAESGPPSGPAEPGAPQPKE
jgi:outer membrane assembly lipoprotein YfiO